MKTPLVLAILDGFGLRYVKDGNAVCQANKPNLDKYWNEESHTTLEASGESVGLPDGQMGNSEVGHMNIGAGRKVYQSLVMINKMIEDEKFYENEKYLEAIEHVKANNSTLHIMGLLSDGGVHAHIDHIEAMIKMASKNGVEKVCVHAFLDGRDVGPKTSKKYVTKILETLHEVGGELATVSGRYYSMDRDKRWDRVELAYECIVQGKSDHEADDLIKYIDECYNKDEFDEFIKPAVLKGYKGMNNNDSVIFMNFRPDRANQLAAVLTNKDYNPVPDQPIFRPEFRPENLKLVQTMQYSEDVLGTIAFTMPEINNTLGEVVAKSGLNQLRIAETEKYPHVTYFFDGGEDKELENAKRILISSPKVATYDLQPEMSAKEVTDALLDELNKDYLDVVILNFANPDMVGHSGMLEPTIKAIETVDTCVKRVVDKVQELNGSILITADHGNSELVTNEDGTPNTAHTTNEVPFILIDSKRKLKNKKGILADIAPTMLDILGVEKPKDMTGETLIDG